MTTSDSKRPPDPGFAEPLALLLYGLHSRGLVVGPDDAARVAAAFQYSEDWPHARKVRALKALLARSDEERRVIEELSDLFFIAPSGEQETLWFPQPAVLPPAFPRTSRPARPKQPAAPVPSRKYSLSTLLVLGLSSIALTSLAALGYSEYQHRKNVDFLKKEQFSALEPEDLARQAAQFQVFRRYLETSEESPELNPSSQPGGEPTPAAAGEQTPSTAAGTESQSPPQENAETEKTPPKETVQKVEPASYWISPLWVLLGMASVATVAFVRYFVRIEQSSFKLVTLANAVGPRTYRGEHGTPLAPLGKDFLRDLVARLTSASIQIPDNWIDESRTVRETARNAGYLKLFYRDQRQYQPVVFIEDVSFSMVRWPDFGRQILEVMLSQGCQVSHYFMDGAPDSLSPDRRLRPRIPLPKVLAGHLEPILIILSDANALNSRPAREHPDWLGPLRNATWLHPCSLELWQVGARWLKEQIHVLSITDGSSLRQSSTLGEHKEAARPWRAPRMAETGNLAASMTAIQETLGREAFLWLSAGAVLDSAGMLTARNWWAIRNLEIAPAPIQKLQRAWSLPEVTVSSDGSVTLEEGLREALVEKLRQENPDLLSQVVLWGERMLAEDLAQLPYDCLAAITARSARAHLLLMDPKNRKQGLREVKSLRAEGYRGLSSSLSGGRMVPTFRLFPTLDKGASRLSGPGAWIRAIRDFVRVSLSIQWHLIKERFEAVSDLMLILLGLLSVALIAFTYHRIRNEIYWTNYRITTLEQRLTKEDRARRQLQLEAAYLSSPPEIHRRAVPELGMRPPTLEDVIFWEEIEFPSSSSKAPAPSTRP